jgi:hypothetical protein
MSNRLSLSSFSTGRLAEVLSYDVSSDTEAAQVCAESAALEAALVVKALERLGYEAATTEGSRVVTLRDGANPQSRVRIYVSLEGIFSRYGFSSKGTTWVARVVGPYGKEVRRSRRFEVARPKPADRGVAQERAEALAAAYEVAAAVTKARQDARDEQRRRAAERQQGEADLAAVVVARFPGSVVEVPGLGTLEVVVSIGGERVILRGEVLEVSVAPAALDTVLARLRG